MQKKAVLLTMLSEESYSLLNNSCYPAEADAKTFEEIVEIMNKHFKSITSMFMEREKFYAAHMEPSEGIQEWARRIKKLSINYSFGSNLNGALLDRFVLGITSRSIKEKLFAKGSKLTFDSTIELALQTEAARNAEHGQLIQCKSEPVFRMKSTSKHQQRGGRVGHLQKMCKSLENVPPRNRIVKQNFIEMVEHEEKLFSINSVNSVDPIFLSIKLNNREVKAELDSGAAISCISYKDYIQWFSFVPLSKALISLVNYNGSKFRPLGKVILEVQFNNKCESIEIYVIKSHCAPLLGRNFMKKFRVDFTINKITMSNDIKLLLQKFPKVFSRMLGSFTKRRIKLNLVEVVPPHYFPPRPLPFSLKEKVENELNRLVSLGILKPVDFSDWATTAVPVLKVLKTIRLP